MASGPRNVFNVAAPLRIDITEIQQGCRLIKDLPRTAPELPIIILRIEFMDKNIS